MGTTFTPELSVEAASYSPHNYAVRYTTPTGWTLSVTERIEDGRPVGIPLGEQETCLLISSEEAERLIESWEFALLEELAEAAEEQERLDIEREG